MKTISKAVYAVLAIVIIVIATVGVYIYTQQPPVSTEETLKIGILLPFTGFASDFGPIARMGVDLAVSEINSNGGVLGRQIQVFTADEASGGGTQTISAYNDLVLGNNVKFIIGTDFSGDMLAVIPKAVADKVIMMTTSASLNDLLANITSTPNTIFRPCINDTMVALSAVNVVTNIVGAKTLAIVGEDFVYAHEVSAVLRGLQQERGFQIVLEDYFDAATSDYASEIVKVAGLQPDCLFLMMTGSNAVTYIKQSKLNPQTQDIPILVTSSSSLIFPYVVQGLDAAQPGASDYVMVQGFFYTQAQTSKTQQYVNKFWSTYKVNASMMIDAYGYDLVYLYAEAIKAAGTTDPAAVVEKLETMSFVSVLGTFTFSKDHEVVIGPAGIEIPIVQFYQGTVTTIYPPNVAKGTYKPPQ